MATGTDTDTRERRRRLVKGFSEGVEQLGTLPEGDDAEALGQAAALTIARPHVWEGQLGPLLASAQLRSLLGGISREALAQRVKRGTLLALRDQRGKVRYPLFQLDESAATPYPQVPALIKLFRDRGLSSWELATFMTTPQPELSDRSPVDWMRSSGNEQLLLAVARESAATLASQ